MSNAPVSVRFDVQGSDRVTSETRKIATSFDALRTSSGGIISTVKQMESGFRQDAFGNFANSVTNADAKVTGFRTKLTQIGSTFASNATSFGVATASIWGVYNAYDSLEKVQIRAHAAQQRVATLETTVTTLTDRRSDAVKRGNATAEDMAILDERITNAKGKLAVAQERDADLQQDVNEAWGAFASQVGPQAVAAGASIVQLVTNLKGSMGGVIPAIKNFFTSFAGGAPIIGQVNSQTLQSAPIFKNMATGMNQASIATQGLSVSMKGLLIGTGIGAIVAIAGILAQLAIQAAEASKAQKTLEEATAKSDAAMESFTTTTGETQAILDSITKSFGGEFEALISAAERFVDSMNFAKITTEMNTQKEAITDLSGATQTLKKDAKDTFDAWGPFGPLVGLLTNNFGDLGGKIEENDEKIQEHKGNIVDLQKQEQQLTAALILQKGVGDENVEFLLRAIVAGKSLAEAGALLEKVLRLTNGTLDLNTAKTKTWADSAKEGADAAAEWLTKTTEKATADEEMKNSLIGYAERLGITTDLEGKSVEQIQDLIVVKLGLKNATDDDTKAAEEYNKSLNEQQVKTDENIAAQNLLQDKLDQVNESYGTNHDTMNTNVDMIDKLFEATIGVRDAYIDEEFELVSLASQYELNSSGLQELAKNYVDNTTESKEWIATNIDFMKGLTDQTTNLAAVADGHLTARTSMDAFVKGLVSGQAESEQTRLDVLALAKAMGMDMTKAANMTTDEIKKLISDAFIPAEEKAIIFARALNELQTAALGFFSSLTGAEDMKEFNKQWKELDFGAIPKGVRGDVKDFFRDIRENTEHSNEMALAINTVILSITDLGKQLSDKTIHKIMGEVNDDFDKLRGITPEVATGMHALFEPMTKLKGAELDKYIEKTSAAMAEYNLRTADGIFDTTDYNAVIALLPPELQKVIDKTTPLIDETAALTEEQRKIAENRQLKATIDAQTGAFELQKTYVDALNESLLVRATLTAITGSLESKVVISADITKFLSAADSVVKRVLFIDNLRPIVDFLGDHRQFVKAGKEVLKAVEQIDKLRPIVDFMGDHSKSGNFMKAAADVIKKVKEIDGMVATVTIKAKRVGNFSAQHGMHAVLGEDSWIYAHKNEAINISPPGEAQLHHAAPGIPGGTRSFGGGGGIGVGGVVHIEMPVYLFPGGEVFKKFIKDIPLADTGMFGSA